MRKATIPANLLITIIIGIIVLGMGIYLISKWVHTPTNIDDGFKKKVETIVFSTTDKVIIYPSYIDLNDDQVIAIGIKNTGETTLSNLIINYNCQDINSNRVKNVLSFIDESITLPPGKSKIIYGLINKKALTKGHYSCIIKIESHGKVYGNPQLLVIDY